VKTLKTVVAFCLVAVFFVGCSKNANNTNTTTTTSTSNDNSKTSNSTMPKMPTMPANTSSSSTSNDNGSAPTSSSSSEGETFTNQAAGVQFTLPADWTSKNEGESIIAASPHDAVNVVFQVPKDEFNKAVDDLGDRLDAIIKNGKITSPGKESTHNGMRAYTAGGTGEVNGEQIAWEVDILQAKKPFFVLTFAAPEMFKMHQSEYQQLLSSIKKIE
jgi:hypothetical protein